MPSADSQTETGPGRADGSGAAPIGDDFAQLAAPYRRELLAHCYRMLGSVHDAEDLVQETLLRAWRGYADFEGRSSLRTWLYRIATRACLNELDKGHRRVMPSGLAGPSDQPTLLGGNRRSDIAWLEPIPDALVNADPQDPAQIADLRQSTRLALIAAMQLLPARQRAVLILRDVLGWHAGEVAELLGTTADSVNSSLLRSRAQVARLAPAEDEIEEPCAPERRSILDRYVTAFQDADITGLVSLLHDDVELEMPPATVWFAGASVATFLAAHAGTPGDWGMLPARANGQWAIATYRRRDDGLRRAQGLHVLTVHGGLIRHISVFLDETAFPGFGLPPIFPQDVPAPTAAPG